VKNEVLREVLNQDRDATTLVFVRTKFGTEKLMKALRSEGYNADSIHGNKSQSQRDRAIKAFRDGKTTILCATDVAARGIDIPEVARVINLNLPEQPDSYVHRIGRTGRAGRSGIAISLCSTTDVPLLRDIENLMKMEIPVASGAELLRNLEPPKGAAPKKSGSGRRRFGGGGGGGKPDSAKRPHRGGGGRKFGSEGGKRTEGRKKSA
jgi:ATP-dependent RNA helicase RhlE